SQEPRGGELRDEAPPGVAAEKKVRLEIRRVREVACPAVQGDPLVRLDAGPVVFGNIQPAGHVGDPAVQQRGGAEGDEGRQGAPQVAPVPLILAQTGPLGVGGDPLQMGRQGRIGMTAGHPYRVSSFPSARPASQPAGASCVSGLVPAATYPVFAPWPRIAPSMTRIAPPGHPAAARAQVRTSAAEADPDVRLMLKVQQGDETAFPELFQRFGPRVLQYVRRLIGNEARAEEITQDVFVQMFRFRLRYRPESKLTTWVFTIATNLCLNELRRPERQLRVDLWERKGEEGEHREEPALPDPDAIDPEQGA